MDFFNGELLYHLCKRMYLPEFSIWVSKSSSVTRMAREKKVRDKVRERRRKVEARDFRDRYPIKGVPPPPSPMLLHQQNGRSHRRKHRIPDISPYKATLVLVESFSGSTVMPSYLEHLPNLDWVSVSEVSGFHLPPPLPYPIPLLPFIPATDDELHCQFENSGKYILLHKWYRISPLRNHSQTIAQWHREILTICDILPK